jgi:hypothetical protein
MFIFPTPFYFYEIKKAPLRGMRIGAFGCPIGKLKLFMNFLNFTPINPISKVGIELILKNSFPELIYDS